MTSSIIGDSPFPCDDIDIPLVFLFKRKMAGNFEKAWEENNVDRKN